MLQTLERTHRDSRGTKTATAPAKAATRPAETNVERDDGLIATAGPIMMAAYAVVLIVAVLTFKGNGEALLAVAISIAFALVFFGVPQLMPQLMMRTRARHDTRWRKAGTGRDTDTVETYTGRIARAEAVLHMVIVPLVVSAGFVCFAVIWVLVRP